MLFLLSFKAWLCWAYHYANNWSKQYGTDDLCTQYASWRGGKCVNRTVLISIKTNIALVFLVNSGSLNIRTVWFFFVCKNVLDIHASLYLFFENIQCDRYLYSFAEMYRFLFVLGHIGIRKKSENSNFIWFVNLMYH